MTAAARPALAAALLAALVAGCYHDPPAMQGNRFDLGGPREGRDQEILRANPSKVVAAELAFARLAQEQGQWTAFAEYATRDAVMFVPEPVVAQDWLKGRANPPQAVRWQPHQVWSSCDGSLAVTKGAWQRPDGSVGYFTTVWQRQEDGEYKWVMDQGDVLAEPLEAPEMIEAKAAQCHLPRPMPAPGVPIVDADEQHSGGRSDDFTLHWDVITRPDGSRTVDAIYWDGSDWKRALREQVAGG
jgi:hypothetical protein